VSAWLFDVNVLIALLDIAHSHHPAAREWFRERQAPAWATCPITEIGFVRVVSDRKYSAGLMPAAAADLLARFKSSHRDTHNWWPDEVSLTDGSLFRLDVLLGAKQVTDAYLLGLAFRKGGRLASFDRSLPWQVVRGASPKLIETIR